MQMAGVVIFHLPDIVTLSRISSIYLRRLSTSFMRSVMKI